MLDFIFGAFSFTESFSQSFNNLNVNKISFCSSALTTDAVKQGKLFYNHLVFCGRGKEVKGMRFH